MELYDYDKRNYSTVMTNAHFHNYHELYYLEHGHTKYFIGNKIHFLETGDMIFVPSGAFHKTSNEDGALIERHIFYFQDSYVSPEYMPYIEKLKQNNYIKFPSEQIHRFTEITRKISQESKYRQDGYDEMQKLYLQQMLILISRFRTKETQDNYPSFHHTIQDAVTYISKNVTADLSLNTLAAKYNVSPNYFSKQFKYWTGIGLNEYINIAKITAAEKMLMKTDKSITQIALECGFNDSNYFASVFKKLKGVTPKKFSLQNQ